MANNHSHSDHHRAHDRRRSTESTQAWLVGGGIASLATAVFLIKDAKVPASNIHIFDIHSHPGGGIGVAGDADKGYVLSSGQHISFHDACVKKLLSLIPCPNDDSETLWDRIFSIDNQQDHHERPVNRLFYEGSTGPIPMSAKNLGLDLHSRIELIKLMLETEEMLSDRCIADSFHEDFFSTKFWKTWSTT